FALDTLPDHEEAYFLTVHKSQGSEYENLYFYIPPVRTERKSQPESEEIEDNSNISLANRQILYTGITRAKSNLRIFGSKEGWEAGIKNSQERLTGFRIQKL
ncbi:MAG: ATP-binding domain-containing protein, partial [Leptospira sp.]|nr:ATP-binding domain-containing protein [Leptospira sp.]